MENKTTSLLKISHQLQANWVEIVQQLFEAGADPALGALFLPRSSTAWHSLGRGSPEQGRGSGAHGAEPCPIPISLCPCRGHSFPPRRGRARRVRAGSAGAHLPGCLRIHHLHPLELWPGEGDMAPGPLAEPSPGTEGVGAAATCVSLKERPKRSQHPRQGLPPPHHCGTDKPGFVCREGSR